MSLLGASLRELANARAMDVAVVNPNGDQIAGFDSSRPSAAALSTVAVSGASATLAAANANRRQLVIFNNTSKNLYVAFAATASTTAFTFLIPAGGVWESKVDSYTGVVSGILASGTGNALVTEVTTT